MAFYDYARVSPSDQDLSCRREFSALPCVKSFMQKKPAKAAGPEVATCSSCVSLMVTRLDRLAHSINDLQDRLPPKIAERTTQIAAAAHFSHDGLPCPSLCPHATQSSPPLS
jgi:hypothetical protein